MSLLGSAAMLLWYDIVPDQISEHDEWHTRQHFPERVGIPGFLRAQRWVSISSGPRYFVVYEVSSIDILSSAPYLDRLNNPTPWTQKVMPHFRGMVRGFCRLENSSGTVLGGTSVSVRYAAAAGKEAQLHDWLNRDLIPRLERRSGFASVYMLRSDRVPEMTAEQRIRGRDASVELVLLVTGYSPDLAKKLSATDLSPDSLEAHGALPGATTTVYQLACLSDRYASVPA
jgi:hypothetical protein